MVNQTDRAELLPLLFAAATGCQLTASMANSNETQVLVCWHQFIQSNRNNCKSLWHILQKFIVNLAMRSSVGHKGCNRTKTSFSSARVMTETQVLYAKRENERA